jgi:hydrogenase-4 component E
LLLGAIPVLALKLVVAGVALALIETVSAKLRVFRAPEFLATAFLFAVLGLLVHLLLGASAMSAATFVRPAIAQQPGGLAAAAVVRDARAAARRDAREPARDAGRVALRGHAAARLAHGRNAICTFRGADARLKVMFLPWLLHRLIRRLGVYWDTDTLLNIPGTMLVGLVVVVFSFGLAQPITALASTATRSAIGIAVAVILLAFLTMITRRKAMSQVIGFLSMENGLFFGAMSATYGMPMVVEMGVALDVLVAMLVLGVFFFQIREQFDSLDLERLESREEEP